MEGQQFYETFNLLNVQYLASLSDKELITLLKENKNLDKRGHKPKITPDFATSLRYYLRKIVKNEGETSVKYKYGDGCDSGRLYSNGLALQSIPNNIRSCILDDAYNDYDIINAHPTILLHLAKSNPEISSCNYLLLEKYVNNRDALLLEHNFTKQDLLVALYSDRTRSNVTGFLKGLHGEFTALKKVLTNGMKTDNHKNPNSSCLSKLICEIENNILQSVLKNCIQNPKECALCFDGFLCKEQIAVESLDKLTEEYGIRWKIKPRNNTIVIPEDFVPDEYLQVKTEFETENFMVTYPLCFWHLVNGKWRVYNEHNFATVNRTLPKIDGTPFVAAWLCDPTRLEYAGTNFYPYNKNPAGNPSNIFNTFIPFTRLAHIDDPIHPEFETFLEMFDTLIFNLCERDDKMVDFLKKYIAHMIQYPEILPETIIYLKGIQGIGKDALITVIDKLIDNTDYLIRSVTLENLFGRFNFAVGNKLCIDVNEMSNSEAIQYKEDIKKFATLHDNLIENKGVDGFSRINNVVRLFIKSNNNKPVCLSESSRREFVVEGKPISNDVNYRTKFFDKFWNLLKKYPEIYNNLFKHFNDIDLEGFDVRNSPRGKLFCQLQTDNVRPIYSWLHTLDCSNCSRHKKGDILYSVGKLLIDYNRYCKENGIRQTLTPSTMNDSLRPLDEFIKQFKTSVNRQKDNYWRFDEKLLKEYIKNTYFKNLVPLPVIDEDDIISADECEITEDY